MLDVPAGPLEAGSETCPVVSAAGLIAVDGWAAGSFTRGGLGFLMKTEGPLCLLVPAATLGLGVSGAFPGPEDTGCRTVPEEA
jgi:hypothetical protein